MYLRRILPDRLVTVQEGRDTHTHYLKTVIVVPYFSWFIAF